MEGAEPQHGPLLQSVITSLIALVGSPGMVFLWKKLIPRPPGNEEAADVVATAFKDLLHGMQQENKRLSDQVESMYGELRVQRGRLSKVQAFMHVTLRLQEQHLAALEHIIVQQGAAVPDRPILPELPDLDTIPLFEGFDEQVEEMANRALLREVRQLRAEVQSLQRRHTHTDGEHDD